MVYRIYKYGSFEINILWLKYYNCCNATKLWMFDVIFCSVLRTRVSFQFVMYDNGRLSSVALCNLNYVFNVRFITVSICTTIQYNKFSSVMTTRRFVWCNNQYRSLDWIRKPCLFSQDLIKLIRSIYDLSVRLWSIIGELLEQIVGCFSDST